jgi:prepilin-type processing-associated H-X9-DG protein
MTYTFPPPAPWISVGGYLLLVLIGLVALVAAFAPRRRSRQPESSPTRLPWRLLFGFAAIGVAAAGLTSIKLREGLAGVLVVVDAIAFTLAVTRTCLYPFGRELTVGSGCAGIFLASVLGFIFIFLPAVQSARESGKRVPRCKTGLRGLGLAIHNYIDSHDGILPDAVSGSTNVSGVSWRISLSPLLDRPDLRSSYLPSVAWDAPENLPVGRTRLDYLICSANQAPTDDLGRYFTAISAMTGPSTIFPSDKAIRLAEITDGTSQTILLGECSGLNIVWTEPRDIDVSIQKLGINLPGDRPGFSSSNLSSYHAGGAYVALADGSVRFLSENIDHKVLHALTTATGGDKLPDDGIW